jgi:hypothetical protein
MANRHDTTEFIIKLSLTVLLIIGLLFALALNVHDTRCLHRVGDEIQATATRTAPAGCNATVERCSVAPRPFDGYVCAVTLQCAGDEPDVVIVASSGPEGCKR